MTGAGWRAERRTNSAIRIERRRDQPDDPRGRPAPGVRLDEGEGQRADRDGEHRGAEGVGAGRVRARAPLAVIRRGRPWVRRQHPHAGEQRDSDDRHVDQEHPAPVRGDEGAAEHRAERGRRSADRGPAADRAGPLRRRRRREQQAQRRRARAARRPPPGRSAPRRASRRPCAAAQAAEASAKTTIAGQERGAAADQVGGPARRDEQRREHDGVGVQHPRQRGEVRAAERPADRRAARRSR